MEIRKKLLAASAAASIAVLGTAVMSSPATARVVCNSNGDCWHTDDNAARYGRDVHAEYHPDDWYFHQHWDRDEHRHWRDYHEGRGYYRDGVWVDR